MAVAVTVLRNELAGTRRLVSGTVTFDASYNTGGEALAPSLLGMYQFDSLSLEPAGVDATHAFVAQWNGQQGATSTVKVYQGDNANAAAAPLVEVPATTNLAALTMAFSARGA